MLRKLDNQMQKSEIGLLSYTKHKNQPKRNKRLEFKTWKQKIPRRKYRGQAPWHQWHQSLQWFFWIWHTHTHKGNKRKSKQVGLYQTKDFRTRESTNKIKDNLPNERKFLQITLIDKRLIFNIQRIHITQ